MRIRLVRLFPAAAFLAAICAFAAAPARADIWSDCPPGPDQVQCMADRGFPEAEFKLGMNRFQAGAEKMEFGEAFSWIEKAALHGHPRAQYMLGMMYLEGWGTEVNLKEAYRWVLNAQANGVFDRQGLMQQIEEKYNEQQAQGGGDAAGPPAPAGQAPAASGSGEPAQR